MEKFDDAYEFMHQVSGEDNKIDESRLKPIFKKIDKRVLPILSIIYFLQFLDKSLINYAGVMGIKDHLENESDFSDIATILYAGYIIFEPIVTILFQKLPFAKFFATTIILWGICVVLHIVCLDYASLMTVRFFLGALEATAATGILLCNGMWYSHKQQLARFGVITSQVGLATIVGGLLSFGFQHVDNSETSLESWQIFFLLMGLITIVFGILTLIFLPDNPMSCKFLDRDEKVLLLTYLKGNHTGIENKTFKVSQIKEYVLDKQTWLMSLLTIMTMIPTGAIITFSVTIISSFGFNSKHSALMQMPVGVSSLLSILIPMYGLAYLNDRFRTLMFIALLVIGIIGYFLMIFTTNQAANLIGVYFANSGTCVITLIYSWNNRNTAGYTKRLIRNCFTMICISIGALIGPQLFKTDYPRYIPAKITLVCLSAGAIPLVTFIGYLSKRDNKIRDNLSQDKVDAFYDMYGEDYEYKDLTDIQNINFRYGY